MFSKNGSWGSLKVPSYIWMFLFGLMVFLLTIINTPLIENIIPKLEKIQIEDSGKGYLIKTEGCKIPELPITSDTIRKYFKYESETIHCNKDKPALVESNLTSLFILENSFESYNISNKSLLNCCYKELKRIIPDGQPDKQYAFGSICFQFEYSIAVNEEFVFVKCDYSNQEIYNDVFAFIPMKSNISRDSEQEKLNVLVIGIDGISRINFHRQMPKFVSTLKDLEFQEFLGYNKIADNTYPNLITVLTGHDERTIAKTCRKTGKYFDDCPFIWNSFKNKSYITLFAEDSAWMGIFNYVKYGFQKQPTDYMWGFFDRVGEDLLGNEKDMNVIQCIGSRIGYKMIVQYLFDFVYRMKSWNLPYFAFSWSSSLSHDYVNKPRIGDEFYRNIFQTMFDKGFFENTVTIVMSDHGIRFGSFRETYQGRVEERLPFLFIRLPANFVRKYPRASSNLKMNLRKLTTPFDLHETLYDLSIPDNLNSEFIEAGHRKSETKTGLSLFHQIKPTRTCEDAGIANHWCACMKSTPVEITAEIIDTTNYAVNYLNGLLKGYKECAKLQLKKVRNAQRLSHATKSLESKIDVQDFLVSFETEPGDGSFEATIRKTGKRKLEIVGTVSRLNLYGKQSACITDFHLKLYCYCKKKLWE
ncbi:hypothetical protein HHI36_013522 [Cryptolaemus montrouzieri]|uniref:DUF229 domain containing protein n=1 Tax=Cryptolaemus montrouzieri TaxID=559131 RepID=A0ABD2NHM3_9CUCU